MEQAWLTHTLPEQLPEELDRLYFGVEFCCWRMPSLEEIYQAIALCRQRSLPFTLVTPILYESWLPTLSQLLFALQKELQPEDELLISDLGLLSLAAEVLPDVRLVCGRALSGQKRGPRILDLSLTESERDYFRQGSWYSAGAVELLSGHGIERVELDNLLQGIAPLPAGLRGTLHLPYAMVTTSRNCPYRSPRHDKPCQPSCGEAFSLETPQTPVPLLQAGNSQFLRNDRLPDDLSSLGIDRVVRHHSLPA